MKLALGITLFATSFSMGTQATSAAFMFVCFGFAGLWALLVDSAINDKFKKWGKP